MNQLAIIFGIFIILQAILFAIYSAHIIKNWQTAEAEVFYSDLCSSFEPESSSADINYEFKVYGKTYQGSKISPFNFSSSFEWQHKKIIEDYPKGTKAKVYYKKQNPNKSYLNPKIYRVSYLLASLSLGTMFIWAGLSTI